MEPGRCHDTRFERRFVCEMYRRLVRGLAGYGFFVAESSTRNRTLAKPSHSRVLCLSGWGVTACAFGFRTPITAPQNNHMNPNCSSASLESDSFGVLSEKTVFINEVPSRS